MPLKQTLAHIHGRRGVLLPMGLFASLICNIFAVAIPFLAIDAFLKGNRTYSLPHSVELMWASKLYVIAIVIVVFSIVFPFFKLGAMAHLWFRMRDEHKRRRWIETLEYLGKWSFLDIFVVVTILVLTNDQLFISARPLPGVYCFITAIVLSMICSMAMEIMTRPAPNGPRPTPARLREPWWLKLLLPVLLLIMLVALVAAIGLPFLRIDQFLLADRAHSVIRSVGALWREGNSVISVLIAVLLVAAPLLQWAAMAVLWSVRSSPERWERWRRRVSTAGHWAMLDVFALALLLFLTEGHKLVKTQVQPGLYLVVIASAVALAASLAVRLIGGRGA